MKVKEIMTPDPIVVTEKHTLGEVSEIFLRHRIDGAPVVDENGKLVNIITKTDLIRAFMKHTSPATFVAAIPRRKIQTVSPEADVKDIWEIKVGRLPVVNEDGTLVGILTRTDISKGLLSLGLEEAAELEAIFNSTNNGFVVVDKNGIITRCNPSAIRILDLGPVSVVGENIQDVFPDFRLLDVLSSGQSLFSEKLQAGEKILVCDRIPLFYGGEIIGAMAIFQDISEFQTVIEELQIARRLSEKLDAVIESSYDGIYLTDGEANTLRVNKSYERITGVNRNELIGRNMRDLEREGYISQSVTLLVLQNRKTTTIQQYVKTGKHILVTGNPIFDKNGEITMVVTNVRDITELTHLKEELEKNKELTQRYYSELEEMKVQLLDTGEIVAKDKKMIEIMQLARRIASVDTTVILLGETGVGKEEVAKFIHKNSHRKDGPFIKINCGAIPANLLESELFGYEKGAFTGASPHGKLGLFELAAGGTLLLDEVGELPLEMQVKLLRALQEREIKRVGGIHSIKIDVRIIAATNRDLEEMVRQKRFREDLYYRLNVVPITIPPLRERKQDILPLIFHFTQEFNNKYGWEKTISPHALNALYDYDWPGNVRELKNMVERLIIMTEGTTVNLHHLPSHIIREHSASRSWPSEREITPLNAAVQKVEAELIELAYQKYKNVRAAAKALGIDASTFVRKRQKYAKKSHNLM